MALRALSTHRTLSSVISKKGCRLDEGLILKSLIKSNNAGAITIAQHGFSVLVSNRGLTQSESQGPPNPLRPIGKINIISQRLFSSEESSFSPINWWRGRQEKKEAEKYKQRILEMAEMDAWRVGQMLSELDEAVKSWTAKLTNSKETDAAKQMHKTLTGIVSVVGEDATEEKLSNMSRKEKLEAAVEGECTVEEVNILITQFQTMSLMHRIVRKRKLEGKPIPQTAESMQAIMQAEGARFLSKDQKKRLGQQQAKKMTRKRR